MGSKKEGSMKKKILDVWVVDEKEFNKITKEKPEEIIKEGEIGRAHV